MTIELSDSERERYGNQIRGELGQAGQLGLKRGRAIVIGAGVAGATAAAQLASSGVGHLAVVDGGIISLGDLAGQAIYYTPDLGEGKADTLAGKLGLLNPEVQIDSYPVHADPENTGPIIEGHSVVLDCSRDAAVAAALQGARVPVLRPAADQRSPAAAGADLGQEAIRMLTRSGAETLA